MNNHFFWYVLCDCFSVLELYLLISELRTLLPFFLPPNIVCGFDFGVVGCFVVPVEDVKEYTFPGFFSL